MTLLEYHRLRSQEERSWNRERLRQAAGDTFREEIEPLLPKGRHAWAPDQYARFTRSQEFEACVALCERYRLATEAQRTWLRSREHSTLLARSALAGADMPALFREAADLAGPAMGTLYREWAGRDRYLLSADGRPGRGTGAD